ncbi:MAG: DUF6036 family nucleotidyltransferase [Myxococcota bacterium]
MALNLIDELKHITACLEQAGVTHALCGGLALAVHGAARATTDIDLLIHTAQVDAALRAARSVGYRFEAAPMVFSDGMQIRRITKVIDGEAVTLDLILEQPNLANVLANRERVPLDDAHLWVVSRAGLIEMKLASSRPQDQADVARLIELDR